jgi:trans-aconitate 2-methyltransferase
MSQSALPLTQTLRITFPSQASRALIRRCLSTTFVPQRQLSQAFPIYNRAKTQHKDTSKVLSPRNILQTRYFTGSPSKMSTASTNSTQAQEQEKKNKKDWSAAQYLKFGNERTRPVYDLVSQVIPHMPTTSSPRIYDLGCGPGNSTKVLCDAFPGSRVTGMDSSPDMLRRANTEFSGTSNVDFVSGDVSNFSVDPDTNLIFSNAVFHWLRCPARIPALVRLFESLAPGGILAIQVPDNYHERSHTLMRTTASLPSQPWSASFSDTNIGDINDASRPDLDPIEPPADFYNALLPHAQSVNIWRTKYHHVLKDAGAIVEWVKGTGLQPYLNKIGDEDAKAAFLKEYERGLKEAYPELRDGKVLLGYPRLFVVAVRN